MESVDDRQSHAASNPEYGAQLNISDSPAANLPFGVKKFAVSEQPNDKNVQRPYLSFALESSFQSFHISGESTTRGDSPSRPSSSDDSVPALPPPSPRPTTETSTCSEYRSPLKLALQKQLSLSDRLASAKNQCKEIEKIIINERQQLSVFKSKQTELTQREAQLSRALKDKECALTARGAQLKHLHEEYEALWHNFSCEQAVLKQVKTETKKLPLLHHFIKDNEQNRQSRVAQLQRYKQQVTLLHSQHELAKRASKALAREEGDTQMDLGESSALTGPSKCQNESIVHIDANGIGTVDI